MMLGGVLLSVVKLLKFRPAGVRTFSKIGVLGKDYQSEKNWNPDYRASIGIQSHRIQYPNNVSDDQPLSVVQIGLMIRSM
jgi:hypothetical protein